MSDCSSRHLALSQMSQNGYPFHSPANTSDNDVNEQALSEATPDGLPAYQWLIAKLEARDIEGSSTAATQSADASKDSPVVTENTQRVGLLTEERLHPDAGRVVSSVYTLANAELQPPQPCKILC